MDLDPEEKIDESEIDALGIKKKDDALIDIDEPDVDPVIDPAIDPTLTEEEEEGEKGIAGDDAELEAYMFSGYEENY